MITIAFNEEEGKEDVDKLEEQVNSASDKINVDPAKEKINNGKEKVKKVLSNKKVMAFIASHIVPILIVLAIIILILITIGQYAFFTTMPGLVLEKIKEFGLSVWAEFKGFFTGDRVEASVSKEDVLDLAQYLQNMGYDIESCGFGKAEYEDVSAGDEAKTKTLKSVGESVDGKEYLKSYLASNEATFVLANWSLKGFLKESGSILEAYVKLDPSKITSNEEISTGMINILDTTGIIPDERFVKIDRQNEKMTVYTNAIYLPIIGPLTDLLGLTTNGAIQWGSTFSYDMSSWTAKYGKPLELFLSVHLSTMMPDLAYRISEDKELNTKVNIVLQNINVKYETKVKSINGNESNLTGEEIIDKFLNYGLTGEKYEYTEEEEVQIENSTETETVEVDKDVNFYDEILANLNAEGNQSEKNKFFRNIIKQIDGNWFPLSDMFGINVANALIDEDEGTGLGRFLRKVSNNLIALAQTLLTGDSEYIVYVRRGNDEVPGLDGITYDDLLELADIAGQGVEDGIDNVKWPYIQSVTKHWYYNDIDFSKGVYRKASTAKKKIKYESQDEESSLTKHNIDVELDATLTADEGIVYQVCEPEATGPNQHIVDIFMDKYYKYDGTEERAKEIDNAKKYDKYGTTGTIEYNGLEKEEVSFEENKANALAAFSILENMHTEEAELAYRNLKDLVVNLNYFTKSELTSDLKNAMMWIIEVGNKNDDEFNITKDENEYGMQIKDVKGKNVLAPENCEITNEGGVATLKFTKMSDSTVELLKFIYEKDYKKINPDILVGLTMKIKGIENIKTGSAKRGDVIGQASDDLEVIMFDIDKSVIEDIEEYMIPKHNNVYEKIMKEKMTENYGEGIDIGRVFGDGLYISGSNTNGNNGNTGNSAVSTGHGTWTYSESDIDLLCAITASEDQGSYEGALAVITTACNRTESAKWKNRGSDPLSQYRSKGQFAGYYEGHYTKWLDENYPSYVRKAVEDALNGIRNHSYGSFRANKADGREQIGTNGNWYFDVIV